MQKYRFIKFQHGHKWYAESRGVGGIKRSNAALFTELDFIQWGEAKGWVKEELGEDKTMPGVVVALPLPGLD